MCDTVRNLHSHSYDNPTLPAWTSRLLSEEYRRLLDRLTRRYVTASTCTIRGLLFPVLHTTVPHVLTTCGSIGNLRIVLKLGARCIVIIRFRTDTTMLGGECLVDPLASKKEPERFCNKSAHNVEKQGESHQRALHASHTSSSTQATPTWITATWTTPFVHMRSWWRACETDRLFSHWRTCDWLASDWWLAWFRSWRGMRRFTSQSPKTAPIAIWKDSSCRSGP